MKETRQIPVQKGKTYDISIVRLGSSGEGVGRYEGFTVFVPFALPGETVRARITLVKKTYTTASLVEVLKPSPDRIQPQCPVYDRCGGCQLQHLSYEGELKEKRQQVRDALERIGHLQASTSCRPWAPIRPGITAIRCSSPSPLPARAKSLSAVSLRLRTKSST